MRVLDELRGGGVLSIVKKVSVNATRTCVRHIASSWTNTQETIVSYSARCIAQLLARIRAVFRVLQF